MKKLKFIAYILVALSFTANGSTLYTLKEGLNNVDLNNNGTQDLIVFAIFDNNTSHPNQTASIFIRERGQYSIVPAPDDSSFVWSDFSLSASATKIVDFELHKYNSTYFMIRGEKYADKYEPEDLSDATVVKFTRYKIANSESDPGISAYYWKPSGSYITSEKYLNVNDAFRVLNMGKFQ